MRYLKLFENFESGKIEIPEEFQALKNEMNADSVSPEEVISLWNELVLPEVMGDGSELINFEDGFFFNEDGEKFPTHAILDEINYALSGDDIK